MITVLTFWWQPDAGSKFKAPYTADDVRKLQRMVANNLSEPHEFAVITDQPELFADDAAIRAIPINRATHVPGTCYVRLMTFHPDGLNLIGARVLLMDVDCVITASLDPLLDTDALSKFWRNPNHDPNTEDGRRRGFYQGSMQLFTVGATTHLWSDFDPKGTPAWLNRRFGGAEQCWISERLNASYPEPGWDWTEPYWSERDGVYGAGRLFNGKMGNGVTSELPENARIVFTPGDRSPSQPEFRKAHPWVERFWHAR